MITPKQGIRIPLARCIAACQRARRVHHTDVPKVVNAFLVKYNSGELDDQVSAWLTEITGVEHQAHRPSADSG